MPDKIYEVPAEWAKRAYIDDAKYHDDVRALARRPEAFWAEAGQAHSLVQTFYQGQEHLIRSSTTSRSNGSRTARPTPPTTASTVTCTRAATRSRSSGKATIRRTPSKITYRELHDEVCRFANVLRNRNVKKGDRVTIYLPMIPEAAYAMLACARIGAIHSVVFGGFSPEFARRPHRGLQVEDRHHRRRRSARRPQGAAEGQHRRGDRQGRRRRSRHRGQAHRRAGRHAAGPRRLVRRRRRHGDGGVPVRRDERGGPAVHPLHLGLDRQAEGRAAHHRRLSGLRRR